MRVLRFITLGIRNIAARVFGFNFEIETLRNQLEESNSRAVSLFEETERQAKRIKRLNDTCILYEDQRNMEHSRAEAAMKEVIALTETLTEANKKISDQRTDLTKCKNAIGAYKGQATNLKRKIALLENKLALYEVENSEN